MICSNSFTVHCPNWASLQIPYSFCSTLILTEEIEAIRSFPHDILSDIPFWVTLPLLQNPPCSSSNAPTLPSLQEFCISCLECSSPQICAWLAPSLPLDLLKCPLIRQALPDHPTNLLTVPGTSYPPTLNYFSPWHLLPPDSLLSCLSAYHLCWEYSGREREAAKFSGIRESQ